MDKPLIQTINLKKYYYNSSWLSKKHCKRIKAVDEVSFCIEKGQILGLVGESGCGKSTIGKLISNLEKPTGGEIYFEKQRINTMNRYELKEFRRNVQIIFQDSYSSFNPKQTIEEIIDEPLINYKVGKRMIRQKRIDELMKIVGLSPKDKYKYPHEFSGGQRQRINIARALALKPKFIICDEPVSSLDVSVQAQILNLLKQLKEEYSLSYLFISHDLAVVEYISDKIAVMNEGKFVEIFEKDELLSKSHCSYTQKLFDSVPTLSKP